MFKFGANNRIENKEYILPGQSLGYPSAVVWNQNGPQLFSPATSPYRSVLPSGTPSESPCFSPVPWIATSITASLSASDSPSVAASLAPSALSVTSSLVEAFKSQSCTPALLPCIRQEKVSVPLQHLDTEDVYY